MELLGHKLVGSGKAKILVMHNWFADSSSYEPMIPYLETNRFSYLFVDLRGYGRSMNISGSYSANEASEDVVKLTTHLGWEKFHVIGHSMSGMIAQKVALDHPKRVKSVIAITPVPASGSPKPPELMTFLEEAALSNTKNATDCIHLLTSRRYSDSFAKKMVADWHQCSIPEARVAYLHMFSNTDFSASVKGLKTPMLVLFGEYDFEGEEGRMRDTFVSWYPNARLECNEASGHFPMQETPPYLAAKMEAFLSDQ